MIGVWLTLWQVVKARKASEATKRAIDSTVNTLSAINHLSCTEQLCSRSRDVMHLISSRNITSAAIAAFELRESLAKHPMFKTDARGYLPEFWDTLEKDIMNIHEALESAVTIKKLDSELRESLVLSVSSIHMLLSELAGKLNREVGKENAYSK